MSVCRVGRRSCERALAAQAIDRLAPRRGGDPGAGVGRHAVARPGGQRDGEGVLERVLGQLEVAAEMADQRGEDASGLLAEGALDGAAHIAGDLHHRAHLDVAVADVRACADAWSSAASRSARLDDVVAAQPFLGLGERPVGDHAVAVAHRDGRRRRRRLQRLAADEGAGVLQALRVGAPRLPLRPCASGEPSAGPWLGSLKMRSMYCGTFAS